MKGKWTEIVPTVISGLTLAVILGFGKTIISVDKRLATIEALYKVEIPAIKEDISRNDDQIDKLNYYLPKLIAKREDD